MNLRSIDLNLVPVLRALLAERSVTRAAQRIGLSQPATSNALARLRGHLGDALLVKSGNTMLRTPLGSHLLPLLELACDELERLLHYEVWSPDTIRRRFVLAMSDNLMVALARPLEAILAEQAPNVTVRFGSIGPALHDELISGRVNVAYLGHSEALAKSLNMDFVVRSRLAGIVSSTHRFAADPPKTLKDFVAAKRVGIKIPEELLESDQTPLSELMGSANMAMEFSTTHLSTLPYLADKVGAMAVVPSYIAASAARTLGMTIIEIPEQDVHYDLCQYWSPRFETDPGHLWMREILTGLLREI